MSAMVGVSELFFFSVFFFFGCAPVGVAHSCSVSLSLSLHARVWRAACLKSLCCDGAVTQSCRWWAGWGARVGVRGGGRAPWRRRTGRARFVGALTPEPPELAHALCSGRALTLTILRARGRRPRTHANAHGAQPPIHKHAHAIPPPLRRPGLPVWPRPRPARSPASVDATWRVVAAPVCRCRGRGRRRRRGRTLRSQRPQAAP
jgi:hypothetical protein